MCCGNRPPRACACCGYTATPPCPVLPGQVAGQPVTEVGPYCFSARREPGPGALWPASAGDLHPICGDFVQRVTLPDSVTALHNGAFYNCRALERLDAGPRLDALGSDLFTNCRRLKTFVLHTSPDTPTGLKKMLAAVSGDIAAEFCRGDRLLGRIFCPEYQEVLDENTPAHIFNRNIEGIGYRYRQCFTDGAVNWAEYDEAFAQADAEEPPAGLCRVALSRLAAPFALSAAAKARYEAYLHSHGALALELAIARRSRGPDRAAGAAGLPAGPQPAAPWLAGRPAGARAPPCCWRRLPGPAPDQKDLRF